MPSLQKPISRNRRKAALAIATFIYVLSLAYGAYINRGAPQSITFSIDCCAHASLLSGNLIDVHSQECKRKCSYYYREEVLHIGPLLRKNGEDIESYCWEEFKGLRRVPWSH